MYEKSKLLSKNNERTVTVFSVTVLIFTALFFIIAVITRGEFVDSYFHHDHYDTAMDYFNMLFDARNEDPYVNHSLYPAICFVFWKVMIRIMPDSEIWQKGGSTVYRDSMLAQLGYFLFISVCLLIIVIALQNIMKGKKSTQTLFVCALIFSGPMAFLIERGNILLAVVACLMMFAAFYDSDKKWQRYIAYFCLSIAAAIKLYPALFGLMVLKRKRYKEAVVLMFMGVAAFILPFFAFNGLESLRQMIENFSAASDVQLGCGIGINYSFDAILKFILGLFGQTMEKTPKIIAIIAAALPMILFFMVDDEWQEFFLITLVCLWVPDFSYTYCLTLFFLAASSFFFKRKSNKNKKIYTVLFIAFLAMTATPMVERINSLPVTDGLLKYPLSYGTVIVNIAIIAMLVLIMFNSIFDRCSKSYE